MQLVANRTLVRNRVKLGMVLYIGALGIFLLGWMNSQPTNPDTDISLGSWVAILVGMVLWALGLTQLRRWGPRSRQTEALKQALRRLDDRYKVYAFLSPALPDYVVVGPAGVHVVVAREDGGHIRCRKEQGRDRWRKAGQSVLLALFDPPLGNPSAEAYEQVRRVRELLDAESLGDVPVSAVAVFTSPKARLNIESCGLAVTRLGDLEKLLRRSAGKGQGVQLNGARVRQVQAVFDRRMQAAPSWR